MKKILLIPFLLFAVLSMAACSDPNEEPLTPDQPEQPENPGGGGNDEAPSEPTDPTPGGNGRYLVLFASRSGNTERMANEIRTQLDCDILEVEPQTPYDEDYNSMLSRAQEELAAIRQGNYPPIKTSVENFDAYDIVFVGYPIWWGIAAWPVDTFVKNNDFTGKTVIPFATSSSSGMGQSGSLLADMTGTGEWQEGQRFSSGVSSDDVQSWVNGLGL